MAWVERRVTRTTQPHDVVKVNWENQNTKGLLGSWVGSGRGKAAFGTDAIPQGNAVAKIGQAGVGLSNTNTGSNNFWKVERGTTYTYTQQVTFEAVIEVDSFTSNVPYISGIIAQYVQPGSSADDRGPFLRFGNGSSENRDKPFFAVMQNNTERGVLGPSLQTGREYHLLGTYDGATVKLFIDGVLIGTTAATGSFENGPNTYVAIGTDYPGTSSSEFRAFQGRIYLANVYGVGKTDAQAKSLAANPWQIFEPEVERIWISDYVTTGGITQVQSDASLNYVLQAITFQSQGGMYSILGLVNADINSSYYVNEARVNSSSASYVVLGAVTQSQNEEYNVLASLSNTQGSTYNIRSALSQDQGSIYFISESTYREQLVDYVIRSAQFNDQGGTYNILSANTVGNNANLNYVISALIQQDQQENYLVRSSSHQETNGIYTVRASAENSTEGSYIVRGSLSSEAQLDYTVRAEVNSEGTLSYTIRASLSKDQGLMYDILAANNVASSSGGTYNIQATTANNTSCSYQIQGEVIDVPLTNAEMQQLYAWVSELVTKSATKEEIATAVWSKPQSELTVENSIGKWLMQKVLTVSKFLALK